MKPNTSSSPKTSNTCHLSLPPGFNRRDSEKSVRRSFRLQKSLEIEVEESDMSINRLISCPDLTPSINRAETPNLENNMQFSNLSEATFFTPTEKLFNWAEHVPSTRDEH